MPDGLPDGGKQKKLKGGSIKISMSSIMCSMVTGGSCSAEAAGGTTHESDPALVDLLPTACETREVLGLVLHVPLLEHRNLDSSNVVNAHANLGVGVGRHVLEDLHIAPPDQHRSPRTTSSFLSLPTKKGPCKGFWGALFEACPNLVLDVVPSRVVNASQGEVGLLQRSTHNNLVVHNLHARAIVTDTTPIPSQQEQPPLD